MANIRAKIAS